MVNLKKILKLGGFADAAKTNYFGFARKSMPPDTPHDENRPRWRVNMLGQKVEDSGIRGSEVRDKYIDAIANTPNDAARTDIVRAVGVMAEKGDQEAGKYLLALLTMDQSPQVRKCILSKLAFAFRTQLGPFSKVILEGIRQSVADNESVLRGMAVDLLNAASKKSDEHDLNASIKPQNRRSCFVSRDSAWAHVKGIAQAINSSTLVLGLVDMMSHAVLPVRMACWEVLGGKDASATTGRCRELEQRLYRRKQALARCAEELQSCQQAVGDAFDEAMEESREAMTKQIRAEQERGIELRADGSFMSKFQKNLVNNNPGYVAAIKAAKAKEEQLAGIDDDITADDEAYQRVKEELKKEILSRIGLLLQEDSQPIAATNKLLGKTGSGNWYLRRTVVRMVGPLAEAGDANASELLTQSLSDRSPYVRRTVVRVLKQARVADRARAILRASSAPTDADKSVRFLPPATASSELQSPPLSPLPRSPLVALKEAELLEAEGTGGGGVATETPEEKRKLQKARLRRREELDAELRLQTLNVREFGTKEVVALLDSLRMHFMERTDAYTRAARQQALSGAFLLSASDDDLKRVLGMTVRKERTILRVTLKDKVAEYERETDPAQIAIAAQQQLVAAATDNAARIEAQRKEARDEAAAKGSHVRQAMRQDGSTFGGKEGLGCVLFRGAEGDVMFKRVLPCGGIVCEGDVLVKVEQTPVEGLTLVAVMKLLVSYGQMCPCVVRLASQKQRLEDLRQRRREWEAEASKRRQHPQDTEPPPQDLLRTVNVTCHPPPFKEDYIESIGLDIEVYQGDATRSLQMMTVLNRNGFSAYLKPILLDGVKQLVDLAAKHKDPHWVATVGVATDDQSRFMELLKRLALRFKLKDPRPEVERGEQRQHAHDVWRFMQGVTVPQRLQFTCKYRSEDASASLAEFRSSGRTQRQAAREAGGQAFTVLWHEQLGITVEVLHCSTGTFRVSVPKPRQARRLGQSRAKDLGGVEGSEADLRRAASLMQSWKSSGGAGARQQSVLSCFSDGKREEVRGFRAGELVEKVKEAVVDSAEEADATPMAMEQSQSFRQPVASPKSVQRANSGLPAMARTASVGSRQSHRSAGSNQTGQRREKLPSIFGGLEDDGGEVLQGGEGLVRRPSVDSSRKAWEGGRGEAGKTVSGEGFGLGGLLKRIAGKKERVRRVSADAGSEDEGPDSDEEGVVGYHVEGEEGMRVQLRARVQAEMPELTAEIGGGETVGTITWVDPDDADGDGVTGDICEVRWDNGHVGDYRTGFEGVYRLTVADDDDDEEGGAKRRGTDGRSGPGAGKETVIGLHVAPSEGQRVVLLQSALSEMPELLADSGGGPGTITWVDPDDADGDGVVGDICEVEWDLTGVLGDYRTGFEGRFRLALYRPPEEVAAATKRAAAAVTVTAASRGRSGLGRTRRAEVPEEDPWEFLEQWEEEQAAEKRAAAAREMEEKGPRLDLRPRKMRMEGKGATVDAGSWTAAVQTHGEGYGSTIELRMTETGPMVTLPAAKTAAGELVVQLTGDGVVVMTGTKPASVEKAYQTDKAGPEAFRVMADGLTEMSALEATLLVEGVPLSKLQQAVADSKEAYGSQPTRTDLEQRAGSSAPHSHAGSADGSERSSRAGTPGSLPRPCSSRSVQKGAKYGRPVTPISDRPYTPSRPSSRGSVRHRLNIENSFGFETDMLLEPKGKMADKMWGGEEGSEEKARERQWHQTEANVIIDDD